MYDFKMKTVHRTFFFINILKMTKIEDVFVSIQPGFTVGV